MTDADDKQLQKIAAILNKAENTTNEHERDSYLTAAQAIASKHSIDLAMARQFTRDGERAKENTVEARRVEVGTKGDRGAGTYSDLLIAIGESQLLPWVRTNQWVELFGMKFDIDYAVNLYGVLLPQMVAEVQKFLTEGSWRDHGTSSSDARRSFCSAYQERVKERLIEAREDAERDAEKNYGGRNVALVLSNQRSEVNSLYWRTRRNLGTYRKPRGGNAGARAAGRNAGSNANLHNRDGISARGQISG